MSDDVDVLISCGLFLLAVAEVLLWIGVGG